MAYTAYPQRRPPKLALDCFFFFFFFLSPPDRNTATVARYLKAVWPEIFGSVFRELSAKLGPKTP